MNERSLRLLEFDEIRSRVASRALSEEAAQLILADLPSLDSQKVLSLKNLVVEIYNKYNLLAEEPRESLPTIGPVLEKMIEWQKNIPGKLLFVGPISKSLMLLHYILYGSKIPAVKK